MIKNIDKKPVFLLRKLVFLRVENGFHYYLLVNGFEE